jgi:glucose/mannose-6-phosphate isomerase
MKIVFSSNHYSLKQIYELGYLSPNKRGSLFLYLRFSHNAMMKELIIRFPAQLKEAVAIALKAKLVPLTGPIHNVLICGLGGSGIGGTLVKEILHNSAIVPIDIIKSYSIPAYINKHSLVICSSYSGDTEETLEAYKQALERKALIVCITSGGKLAEMAKKDGMNCIIIPSGMPPRAGLGYSLTQLLHVFAFYKLAKDHISQIATSATLLDAEQNAIVKQATEIASSLVNKVPVIYCTSLHEGMAIRFRQQLNENSKILCWHHVLPEMNHNELVGWSHAYPEVCAVLFHDNTEHPRNELRIEICRKIFQKYAGSFLEIVPKGANDIEKKIYWIHLGDWVSYILSEKRNVDAMDIKVIDQLKKELASR